MLPIKGDRSGKCLQGQDRRKEDEKGESGTTLVYWIGRAKIFHGLWFGGQYGKGCRGPSFLDFEINQGAIPTKPFHTIKYISSTQMFGLTKE